MITFSSLRIEEIDTDDVPAEAARHFWFRSDAYTDEKRLILPQFEHFYRVEDSSGVVSFCTEHAKTYATNKDTESNAYVIDLGDDEEVLGVGEIRYGLTNPAEYFKNKPFVGFTRTEQKYQRIGLGFRRLMVMNALAEILYRRPLNSDSLISNEAAGVWRKLVRAGLAESYIELDTLQIGGSERFRFLQ